MRKPPRKMVCGRRLALHDTAIFCVRRSDATWCMDELAMVTPAHAVQWGMKFRELSFNLNDSRVSGRSFLGPKSALYPGIDQSQVFRSKPGNYLVFQKTRFFPSQVFATSDFPGFYRFQPEIQKTSKLPGFYPRFLSQVFIPG